MLPQETTFLTNAHLTNEGDGWRGSGANPWHLDDQTESILFLTNESEKPAGIGFSVTAGGVHYYLTHLKLDPHETRAIDLRKLRDAQRADFKENKIPARATDGSVNWIRLDNAAVTGRVVVLKRAGAIASSYDCCICPCPGYYALKSLRVSPSQANLMSGSNTQLTATANYSDCNGSSYAANVTLSARWSSNNPSTANVQQPGEVVAFSPGAATISATWTDCGQWNYSLGSCVCGYDSSGSDGARVTVNAVPVNFRQISGYDGGNGILVFWYAWDASTGQLGDLSECYIYELVTFPGGNPFYWPSPPWNQRTDNPTFLPPPPGGPAAGDPARDTHVPGVFGTTYAANGFSATQTYNYSCFNGALAGQLLGPLTILRSVSKNPDGTYKYTGTKSGVSASCTLGTDCYQGPPF